jgi:hypothetical protein
MESTIISQVKTKDEIEKLKDELDILLKSLYELGEGSFDATLKSRIRHKTAVLLRREVDGVTEKAEYLKKLQKELTDYEEVEVKLGFEPTEVSIDKFWHSIAESMEGKFVLDIEYMPSIIGGVIIVHDGNYRDFSLKKIMDKLLEGQTQYILPEARRGESGDVDVGNMKVKSTQNNIENS